MSQWALQRTLGGGNLEEIIMTMGREEALKILDAIHGIAQHQESIRALWNTPAVMGIHLWQADFGVTLYKLAEELGMELESLRGSLATLSKNHYVHCFKSSYYDMGWGYDNVMVELTRQGKNAVNSRNVDILKHMDSAQNTNTFVTGSAKAAKKDDEEVKYKSPTWITEGEECFVCFGNDRCKIPPLTRNKQDKSYERVICEFLLDKENRKVEKHEWEDFLEGFDRVANAKKEKRSKLRTSFKNAINRINKKTKKDLGIELVGRNRRQIWLISTKENKT